MLSESTIKSLLEFRRERNWEQFHTPRNLALSVSLEAAELLEVFQWARGEDEAAEFSKTRGDQLKEEIADIAIYITYLANDLGLDIESLVLEKLDLNRKRYPADRVRGRADKYEKR